MSQPRGRTGQPLRPGRLQRIDADRACPRGMIADRTGRRTLLAACAVLIAIFSFVTPLLLGGGPTARSNRISVWSPIAWTILGRAEIG